MSDSTNSKEKLYLLTEKDLEELTSGGRRGIEALKNCRPLNLNSKKLVNAGNILTSPLVKLSGIELDDDIIVGP